MRINIYIPIEKLNAIDKWCAENRYSRSELFVSAALDRVGSGDVRNTPTVGKVPGKNLGPTPEGVIDNKAASTEAVEFVKKKQVDLCEHGAMKGLCKHGC